MTLNDGFHPITDHGYGLPEGTMVQRAQFGRTKVDLWQDPEPGGIWRGVPPRLVGQWPVRMWRYVVHGEMSGCALTEAGAKAKAERAAWNSEKNHRAHPSRIIYMHQMSPCAEKAEEEAFQELLADVDRRFPADPTLYPNIDDEPEAAGPRR